jgi:hypothetical protein
MVILITPSKSEFIFVPPINCANSNLLTTFHISNLLAHSYLMVVKYTERHVDGILITSDICADILKLDLD